MTPYYITQQLNAVAEVADLRIVEMHGGSEYSLTPGSGYDKSDNPFLGDDQDEDYSPRTDVPHLWDIAIRHWAVDSGADLVIVHHPHIIQGFEVYQGKVIAHSLGNFAFDLDYPETMPSLIFSADADRSGFSNFLIQPVFIDGYIPKPATGQLGIYILDYLAMRSRELNTILVVDNNRMSASVLLDSSQALSSSHPYTYNLLLEPVTGQGNVSKPLKLPRYGSISSVNAIEPVSSADYRLGRETIWYGNFEDEGSTLWDLQSFSYNDVFDGERSALISASPGQTRMAGIKNSASGTTTVKSSSSTAGSRRSTQAMPTFRCVITTAARVIKSVANTSPPTFPETLTGPGITRNSPSLPTLGISISASPAQELLPARHRRFLITSV
jgi:hypothetical protein